MLLTKKSGYTGGLLEEEVLGHCVVRWDGYMKFRQAKAFARSNQPKSPCPIAQKFRASVAKEMKVDIGDVNIFTAVGSPLDKFHSIDGWFEFKGLTVTFDITMSHKGGYRADVTVVMDGPDQDFDYAACDVAYAFKCAERGRR